MTAADLTWLDHPWPTFWLADTDALSSPAPAPEAEPTPIFEAALAAHLAAALDWSNPTYRTEPAGAWDARVCGLCGATGKEPCRTPSGKVLRRFHVARG